jgi:hypothetical protein
MKVPLLLAAIVLAMQTPGAAVPTASAHVAFVSIQSGVRRWGDCPTGSHQSCSEVPGGAAALLRQRMGGHRMRRREAIRLRSRRDAGRGLPLGGLSASAAGGAGAELAERERIREVRANRHTPEMKVV